MTDYKLRFECAAELIHEIIRESNEKNNIISHLKTEIRQLKEQLGELRYNPYHDPENGRFTSANGVDISGGSGIIKSEIEKGNVKLEINYEKQARHIKGSSEYVDGRSYLTVSASEAQQIINEKHGTGLLVYDRKGIWKHKELIDCDEVIGVDVNKNTLQTTSTDKGTIHYSKTGTHLVPRKEKKRD